MSQQEKYVYGHVPGVSFGDHFKNRVELMKAGVHALSQAGIHGDPKENGGAYSICLSGGYEDNKDDGDKILYVGSGGQDSSGRQIGPQSFDDPANQSLYRSFQTKRPVRVIRGKNKSSHYAPSGGYRYDGLYVVDSAEMGEGKGRYKMCFFRLRRIIEEGDGPLPYRRLLTAKKMANILKKNAWR
ncbi:hypothetical protein J3R82DRAFT_11679 [Butyriboletus roseoflavus]|nr:hypothetical protein J3R82DRAFT_11679 [Butyriboletus roseoflavus]